jgi:hypothetical protein
MYPVILAVKSQNTITSKVSKERYSFGPLNKFMPSQTNNVSVYQSPFILLYVKDRPFNFQVNALFVLSNLAKVKNVPSKMRIRYWFWSSIISYVIITLLNNLMEVYNFSILFW